MTAEKQQNRVSAFIDVGWLLDGLRGQGMPWRIDYVGLVDHIAGGRTVTGKFAYLAPYPGECYPKKETAQRELLDLLAGQGFNNRVTTMQVRGGMYLDQGVDVMLAMDMFEQAINDNYDVAVVMSRRPTLRHAIEAAQRHGRKVENAFFEYQADPSNELRDASDRFFRLTGELVYNLAL
ncbi:MAG: NYN domain-containing protein [Gammaproteobacteria bacterium]|nr:NYN domain-containing protein [Gammaproteobacteria bacterium]